LRQHHLTEDVIDGVSFLAYYSATVAYLLTLSCWLKLCDYFDFFVRPDLEAPFRRDTATCHEDFLSVRKMIERRAFLFGCFVRLDDRHVSVTIMNMTRLFLKAMKRQWNKRPRSHSLVTGCLHNERQGVPGICQQFSLGLFSCPELRRFTGSWFAYPDGHRIHRWGDQQYYFRGHRLYERMRSRA
jgi:hypothetical protein